MHEIDDAPERAAALFERMAPGLPPPIAVLREPMTLAGVSTWGVRAQGGLAYRLKIAIDTGGAALVRRGSELLGLLTARGVPVPSCVALRAAAPGTDVASESSDITLLSADLDGVPTAIRLSRRTFRTILQNLGWAFGYNVAAIPLAIAGALNPVIAGVAMAFSSVSVVTNSLRLASFRRRTT